MSGQANSTETSSRLVYGVNSLVTVTAILFWGGVMYWASTQAISQVQYATAFVGGILTVYALNETRLAIKEGAWIDGIVLIPASLTLLTASAFFAFNFEAVYLQRQGYALRHEYILARLVIISLMYLTWREFGNIFLALIIAVLGYGMFGDVVPGVLGHAGMSQATLLQVTVTDLYGFYGSLTQLTASWIAPFLLYAGLLFAYGAFDLILRIAIVAAKYIKSGIAQTAVLSSAVIGSINGSYTANAAMTGSFTIPTMQEAGMKSHRAAAIEAVASTSGQVLPPVMGASAFVMANYLGVPYINIVIAGLVPAAILVVSIAVAVHYLAVTDASEQQMNFSEFFDDHLTTSERVFQGIRFGLPFLLLIYLLGVAQYTVMTSALYTVVAMMVTGVLMPPLQRLVDDSSIGPGNEFATQIKNTIHGFRRGAIILAPIAIILIVISGVVNVFSTTGVPAKIALLLINISGGVLLFAVLLGMVVSIVMGVGMPTVAAYVIVAILIVPTFVSDFNVVPITAHYTMFYAAVLSGITPPVATAAVIAAGIAEANFWRTCGAAIRIAAPLFILPIALVYNPGLVAMNLGPATFILGILVLLGAITIIYGLNYPFELSPGRRILARVGLAVLGMFIMIFPSNIVKLAGITIFVGVFVVEKVIVRDLSLPFTRGTSQ